jgi:hypothetical protein
MRMERDDEHDDPTVIIRLGEEQALVRLVEERMRNPAPGIPMDDVIAEFAADGE